MAEFGGWEKGGGGVRGIPVRDGPSHPPNMATPALFQSTVVQSDSTMPIESAELAFQDHHRKPWRYWAEARRGPKRTGGHARGLGVGQRRRPTAPPPRPAARLDRVVVAVVGSALGHGPGRSVQLGLQVLP